MKTKTVELACDAELSVSLAEALTAYAHAAFPEGGSECAQVARQTLLDTAQQCATHSSGVLTLRKRQMPQIRAAVKWFCNEQQGKKNHALLDLLQIKSA